VLKNRLNKKRSEVVTKCNRLKSPRQQLEKQTGKKVVSKENYLKPAEEVRELEK